MPYKLFILLLFTSISSYAQSIALMDRSFKEPVSYTDSITTNMVEKGAFPLFVKDAAKLINFLNWFSKNINSTHPEEIPTQELQWGNLQVYMHTAYSGHYKKYQLVLKTIVAGMSTSLVLVDANDSYPLAIEKLDRSTAYIRNNLALLKEDTNQNSE